ncbi:hypothetical protein GCM10011391_16130 [Pullulanibacillus camelliae]|uniref:Uncharacterized protein n=1 Tax=Pullulanibacillus camelliae TaxID=1707096 RepID=A0A8J2YCT7_9BACL|nr:hypothetical protein GCM10011391_16130 [Pullulanibacillus camelliae]
MNILQLTSYEDERFEMAPILCYDECVNQRLEKNIYTPDLFILQKNRICSQGQAFFENNIERVTATKHL